MKSGNEGLQAHAILVTKPDSLVRSGSLKMIYAVLTDTAENALEIMRQAVGLDAQLEYTGSVLTPDTARALGLTPGHAQLI